MKMDFPVEQTIKARYSVRTYDKNPLREADRTRLMDYANALTNPFGVPVAFHWIETEDAANGQRLGTYGVIKGTKSYIGVTAPAGGHALEAVGYSFEQLLLYAAHLGIGTCWLAATFSRTAFAATIGVKDNELFPAISPVGYPAAQKSLTESLFRKTLQSSQRKDWRTLFFKDSFDTPLTPDAAGDYGFALEMLRLAPSASNKQPWRVVKTEDAFHFYAELESEKEAENPVPIQQVDVGIGACHFHLAAQEQNLPVQFEVQAAPAIAVSPTLRYLFSLKIQPN